MCSKSYNVVESLWDSLSLPDDFLQKNLRLTGDPSITLPSSFNLGVAAQASIAAAGLSAAYFHKLSTGEAQTVTVNARHAALEFFSEAYYSINGITPGRIWDRLAGTYPTRDNNFVRIHTNFPHHREGILSILGLGSTATREAVAQALMIWDSKEFEGEAAKRGMCATAMRSFDEWDKHPQAQAIRDTAPVQLIKISDAPKRRPFSPDHNGGALKGMRVLDLTRIIAGPVCGRTLAGHGADVLLVTSPNLPALPNLDADTSRGKRTTQLDLTTDADRVKLLSLVEESDVFIQNYRPGAIAEKGFGIRDLPTIKPGIVCANLTAWGWDGPWRDRRGFDSLVQTASGFNVDEAKAFATFRGEADLATQPKHLPLQALDHASGQLLAFGIAAALCKTMTEGGSWEVRVSLLSVGNWIRSLGRLGPNGFRDAVALPKRVYPPEDEIAQLSTHLRIPKGPRGVKEQVGEERDKDGNQLSTMLALRHSAALEKTPVGMSVAPVNLNMDVAVWLPRK